MRKSLFVILLLCSQQLLSQGKFTIKGKIEGLDSKIMYLMYENGDGTNIQDSVKVNNGSFTYTGTITTMAIGSINTNMDSVNRTLSPSLDDLKELGLTEKDAPNVIVSIPSKAAKFQFIASPGAQITFTGKITDFVDAYPSGDIANIQLAKINKRLYPLANEAANIEFKIGVGEFKDSAEIEKSNKKIEELNRKCVSIEKDFINHHLESPVSAFLLGELMIELEISNGEAANLYNKLNKDKLKNNTFYTQLTQRMQGLQATAVGNPAPEISSTNTYNKQLVSLKALRGKYVILDFWGTWCSPCVSGMPKMKAYLDKYKGKLDIIGIAVESDNGKSWKEFLDRHKEYQWHQILNQKENDYITKYNVAGYPTKIIIGPKGNIISRFVSESDDFYRKLDDLLK